MACNAAHTRPLPRGHPLPNTCIAVRGGWPRAAIANGIDDDEIETTHDRKSFGEERTYQRDVENYAQAHSAFAEILEDLARRLASKNTSGCTITIKVRFADFHTITRSQTIPVPASSCGCSSGLRKLHKATDSKAT